jgi:hypothetical protein
MDPLQPGEEVRMAELTTGKLFFFPHNITASHHHITLLIIRESFCQILSILTFSNLLFSPTGTYYVA